MVKKHSDASEPDFEAFIQDQDDDVLAAELAATQRIYKTILLTRAQIIERLQTEHAGASRRMLLSTLKRVNTFIKELQGALKKEYTHSIEQAINQGVSHQLDLLDQFFPEINNPGIDALISPIQKTVLLNLEMNLNNYLQSFSVDLYGKISGAIQEGFIHGRHESDVVNSIMSEFKTQYGTTLRSVHHIYQTSYNAANHETLVELARSNPSIRKQWYSTLDKRTTLPCINLHLQVKRVNEPFIEPDSGSEFMYPPAVYGNENLHPAFHLCRSRALPYTEYSTDG